MEVWVVVTWERLSPRGWVGRGREHPGELGGCVPQAWPGARRRDWEPREKAQPLRSLAELAEGTVLVPNTAMVTQLPINSSSRE